MNTKYTYRVLKTKLKKVKLFQILTIGCLSAYTLCLYSLIFIIQNIVDTITTKPDTFAIDTIIYISLLLILLALLGFLSQYTFHQVPIRAKNAFLSEMYHEVLSKSVEDFSSVHSSEIYSLLSNDAIAFSQTVATNSVVVCFQSITLSICIISMFITQMVLALILILFVFFCFCITAAISKNIAHENKTVFKQKEKMTKLLLEGLKNHQVIRILSKESFFANRLKSFLHQSLFFHEKKLALYQSQYMTIYILLTTVLPFLSITIGIYFVSLHWMSIGSVLTMYALSSQLQEPIRQIAEARTNRLTVLQLCNRLSVLLHKEDSRKALVNTINEIKMENVCFDYPDTPVLKNVSVQVYKNDHLLIKGESGAGKSTILSLLMGFENYQKGLITINHMELDTINRKNLYKHILLVNQEPLIFHDTTRQNITLYDSYSDQEIDEVISVCQLYDFYKKNKETLIDACRISKGQAQRISIARMLIRKPDVLLLDEPTSALDEKNGIAFSKALHAFCYRHQITLIIVSHKTDIMSICHQTLEIV